MRLFIALLVTLLPLIRSYPKSGVNEMFLKGLAYHSSLEPTVCQSEECRSAGQTLKASLNESIDPCDDFYEFACGGWIRDHEIVKPAQEIAIPVITQQAVVDKMKAELRKAPEQDDPKTVAYIRDLYKSCVDIETRNSLASKQIRSFVTSVSGWPLLGDHFDEKTFDWRQSVVKILSSGAKAVFSVNADKIFQLNSSYLPLVLEQDPELNTYIVNASTYKKTILEHAIALGARNDSNLQKDIDELVAFELSLAKELTTGGWTYTATTLNDLVHLGNSTFDYVGFVNQIFAEINLADRVTGQEVVRVRNIDNLVRLPQLVTKAPARVVANYLGWVAAKHFDQYLPKNLTKDQMENDCLGQIQKNFEYVLSRLYADSSFTKNDLLIVNRMVGDLRTSFDDIMKASDWLDSKTKEEALNKLVAIIPLLGYPDWIMNNELLDDQFNLTQNADPKNYLANRIYLERQAFAMNLDALSEAKNSTQETWQFPPYTVNAFYNRKMNDITIPVGLLSAPYFNGALPTTINYGSIGMVIGHELTHGFDTEGSKYDGQGKMRDWWSAQVRQKFEEKAECFVDQYSSIVDVQTKERLRGKNTITEDIADNGGIQESFRAYQTFVKREAKLERLPVIDKYSADQQFFVAYAHLWCDKSTDARLKSLIDYEVHSVPRYRVNVPLSNFETFSEVFKCGANSKMNRKDKCVLW